MPVGNNYEGNVVIAGFAPDGKACFYGVSAPTQAGATLTSDNTNVSDGNVVAFNGPQGTRAYVFRTTLTGSTTEVQVLIGTNADGSLTNLFSEVNSGAHPCPYGSFAAVSSHAMVFTASQLYQGSQGNVILVSETSAHLTWGLGVTALSGGAYGGLSTTGTPVNGVAVSGIQEVHTWTSYSGDHTVPAGALSISFFPSDDYSGTIKGFSWSGSGGGGGAFNVPVPISAQPNNTLPDYAFTCVTGSYLLVVVTPT